MMFFVKLISLTYQRFVRRIFKNINYDIFYVLFENNTV